MNRRSREEIEGIEESLAAWEGDDPSFRQRSGWGLVVLGVLAGIGTTLALGWILST